MRAQAPLPPTNGRTFLPEDARLLSPSGSGIVRPPGDVAERLKAAVC